MAKTRSILKRQLEARAKIWPDITNQMLWDRTERDGFSTIPRTMPLIMNIMDGLSEKGFPVGQTYLELWCRLYDELFLTLNRPEEMAFFAGSDGNCTGVHMPIDYIFNNHAVTLNIASQR